MVRREFLEDLKKKLNLLKDHKDILAVLLYGSQLYEDYVTNRSDIDICVVAPDCKDLVKLQLDLYGVVRDPKIDIKVFELLPLYLKIEIIESHEIIFAKDVPRLYEYFYKYRKIWKDQRYRNRISDEEFWTIIKNMKKKLRT